MKKQILAFALAMSMALTLVLSGCSNSALQNAGKELADSIANAADSTNKYVLMVKDGYRIDSPELTYDTAFTAFFGTPRWTYFQSEDGLDVVEFTGDCTYQDVAVKARIQFVVDEDAGTFEPTYLAFNEVPQSVFILVALIEKAFEAGSPEAEALPTAIKSMSEDEATAIVRSWLNNHPSVGYPPYIFDHPVNMGDVYSFTLSDGEFSEYIQVNMATGELSYYNDYNNDTESHMLLDDWYNSTYGNAGTPGKNYPGEIVYAGIPIYQYLYMTEGDLVNTLGMNTTRYGGTGGYRWSDFDGMIFTYSDFVEVIDASNPSLLTVDGVTLDKNRNDLTKILGIPSFEDWWESYDYNYRMEYILWDTPFPVLIIIGLPNPDDKAVWITVVPYSDGE